MAFCFKKSPPSPKKTASPSRHSAEEQALKKKGSDPELELAYLRNKAKREVDFIVIRDGQPWFLAEAKYRQTAIGDALTYFQKQTGAPFAFQVVVDADYVAADCFRRAGGPIVVPARTFLSQLL